MESQKQNRRGRPLEVAPQGYVTIREAAAARKVSYATVYRYVAEGTVESILMDNGSRYIKAGDVKKIALRGKRPGRRVFMSGPTAEQVDRWRRAAGEIPWSSWAAEVLDREARRVLS